MTPQQWGVFYKGENKMAANGNSGNGNTGTGQSAASAQAAAASGNAAASNAANGNTGTGNASNPSGTSGDGKGNAGSANTPTGATNSAGLMGSLIGFGNAVAKGEVGNGGGSSDSKSDDGKSVGLMNKFAQLYDAFEHNITPETTRVTARNKLSANVVAAGDEAYTKARAEGKSEAEAQYAARKAVRGEYYGENANNAYNSAMVNAFEGKNTGPTYNPSIAAQANTNKTIAKGSSEMGPSTPAPPAANNAPGGNLGGETGGIVSGAAPTNTSDATNTGVTNRGSTVANGGTSVTDGGTGGSISSSVTPPSRDASSIGLGTYDTDRANYDQDNWNRGMEVESSSLVSDEECKAFAKRAFMENSEPFKRVRISILKKC